MELIEPCANDASCFIWWTKFTFGIPYVAFFFGGKFYLLQVTSPKTRVITWSPRRFGMKVFL
jgi:hypothetical protein